MNRTKSNQKCSNSEPQINDYFRLFISKYVIQTLKAGFRALNS